MIWWGDLLAFAVLMAALGFGEQHDDLFVLEWHHGYLGALLIVAGLLVWGPLAWAGRVCLYDDALQHAVQRWRKRPHYRSPLHWLYGATLWRWAWVRHLNRKFDGR